MVAPRRLASAIWASVGAFHLCLWTFTLAEAWAWSVGARRVEVTSGAARRPLPSGPSWAFEFSWDGVRSLASVDVLAIDGQETGSAGFNFRWNAARGWIAPMRSFRLRRSTR